MKKINKNNILIVNIQLLLTIISCVAFIMYLFNRKMWPILQFCLGGTLIYMAYSNYKIYNKKYFTIVYLIIGLILIFLNILKIVGVF